MDIQTTLYNDEGSDALVKSVIYTTNGSEVLWTDNTAYTLAAGESLDLTWACIIGLLLAISYTVVSGVSGANYVSKVGCILMYAAMAIGLVLVMNQTGGFATLTNTLDASYFNLFTMPAKTWFSWFLTCFVAFLTM